MPLFTDKDRRIARAISRLVTLNPFLPEWLEYEREALGQAPADGSKASASSASSSTTVWSMRADADVERPEIEELVGRAGKLADTTRAKLLADDNGSTDAADRGLYVDLVLYLLYHRYRNHLYQTLLDVETSNAAAVRTGTRAAVRYFARFADEVAHYLQLPGVELPEEPDAPHLFALFFQIRRAFNHIYRFIVGGSMGAARLRAQIWQSIFTHDMHRYRRSLYPRMGDFTTLIVGESGTGKELVARAIGLSRYVPFDVERGTFADDFTQLFVPLNISALAEHLIESELFGHRRGAFTGALEDRTGWLEACRPHGTVFLDEIGEVSAEVQVKLLRVLQTRTFQRLGDTTSRHFEGKFIAATNRNLPAEMAEGRFRDDFYYRLCSDVIVTPSLAGLLHESPDELQNMVRFIARRVAGAEAPAVTDECVAFIRESLPDYAWPGNFRELEQCVRNVLIRGEYRPPDRPHRAGDGGLLSALEDGALTADELLRRYCTVVYARTGNYQETARRLGIDRRTVRARVDRGLLAQLTGREHELPDEDPAE
ncbi:MAG: sigma 54-interacting transcriptional regulator [Planctomycetota bacterium]